MSDGTIEYSGFKAVYDFIPNPMEIIPFIPKCEFEIGGAMDFIGETNVIWRIYCYLFHREYLKKMNLFPVAIYAVLYVWCPRPSRSALSSHPHALQHKIHIKTHKIK